MGVDLRDGLDRVPDVGRHLEVEGFDRIDTNKDGTVSEAEKNAATKGR